jgi:hypothetical protein
MPRYFQNFLLLLFSTLAALLLSELIAWRFFPVYPPRLICESGHDSWYVYDAAGEVDGLRPGLRGRFVSSEFNTSIRINEDGFRDQSFSEKNARAKTRICVLGDSFTFGYGVEAGETYSQQLKDILRIQGYDVEIYNLGVPATATIQQYRLLQRVLPLQPDIVIIGLLATYADKTGNDLIGNLEFAENYATAGLDELALTTQASPQAVREQERSRIANRLFYRFRAARRWLLQHSHFYRRLELFIGQEFPRGLAHWQAEATRHKVAKGWQITQEWLIRFQTLARQQRFSLVLLHIPFADFRGEGNARMEQLLKDFARTHDILFVDQLLPTMKDHPWQPRDLYFLLDGHWRPLAHKICAEALSDFLIEQNLLSQTIND